MATRRGKGGDREGRIAEEIGKGGGEDRGREKEGG